MGKPPRNTGWHSLVSATLKELLTPVGIEVRSEVQVAPASPRTDLILIRRKRAGWTPEQKALLADGLRETKADHILIELKILESINEDALRQILVYDHLYMKGEKLARKRLQSVLISARTPKRESMSQFGFERTEIKGVYKYSPPPWKAPIQIIVLNELENTPNNAPLKCFASRRIEQKKAFSTVDQSGLIHFSINFRQIISGLWRLRVKETMKDPLFRELTPEFVMQRGKEWFETTVELTPDDELFSLPRVEKRLQEKETEGEAKTLLRLMQRKFGPDLPDGIHIKVKTANKESLDKWIDQILFADSLDEVFS